MAAAAIYANKGISKNYLPNSWTAKPKKATKLETETFADFSQALGQIIGPYQGEVAPADIKLLHKKLTKW